MGATAAAYDAIADWYEQYVSDAAASFTDRVHAMLRGLLGPGAGACLDLCCGTGARARTLGELGWTPAGVDLSRGQLGYAARRLPAVQGDATALPFGTDRFDAVVCVLGHTDMPDYASALREAARVLRPGGRLVHIGVHPCFCGAFADWSDPATVLLDGRYADRSRSFDAWTPHGVRARVGAWHVPLADLLNAVTGAGLRIERTAEAGGRDIPDMFGLRASLPGPLQAAVGAEHAELVHGDRAAPVALRDG